MILTFPLVRPLTRSLTRDLIRREAAPLYDPTVLNIVQWADLQAPASILNGSFTQATLGQAIRALDDVSENSNFFDQATEASRPILGTGANGKPCAVFNGSKVMAHTYARGASKTLAIFVVLSFGAAQSSFRGIYSTAGLSSANETMLIGRGSNPQVGTYGSAERSSSVNIQGAGPCTVLMHRTGNGGDFYVNGVAAGNFADAIGQSGHLGGQTGQLSVMDLFEIIVVAGTITAADITGLHEYASRKWQL